MKKTTILALMSICLFSANAQVANEATPATETPFVLRLDDPEVAAIDRMLVGNCLNRFCYSTDQELLNPFGYAQDQVPSFPPELVAARMKVLDKNTPFDLVYNSTVQGFIDLYAVRRRDITSKVLGGSQMYFPLFEEKLAKHGIPLEMKYLAIVESALNPTAISSAGAGGLWQFMVATGKQYNLNVTSYQDERFDPYKATEAACLYLKFLYKTFGDWQLALAAYNSGPGNVNKAIRRAGGAKDFWAIKPYLPKETQGYVPAFIAVNYVMNHAREYNIYPKNPIASFFELDTVRVTSRVDFAALAKVVDMPLEDLCWLNGTYKLKEIPDNGGAHYLVLPISKLGTFMANEQLVYENSRVRMPEPVLMASKPEEAKTTPENGAVAKVIWETDWKTHTVKRGESLGSISNKYDVSLAQLKKWNKIKGSTVQQGQKLKIETKVKRTIYVEPEQESTAEQKPSNSGNQEVDDSMNYQQTAEKEHTVTAKAQPAKTATPAPADFKYYTVQRGDTLYKIASSKGVSVEQIKQLNSGLRENKLAVGQKIKIKQI